MRGRWSLADRGLALSRAERDGVDLLVIGGGITGAGVLRDAASRGLRALLVERDDFASGTSSGSSKLIHGGLRYLASGDLRLTREACRERDLLRRLHPNLVRPVPFLMPAYEGRGLPSWKIRAALLAYSAIGGFGRAARSRMVSTEAALAHCRDLDPDGLRGGGLYCDARVDDARLVLETIRSARELGGEAASHAEVTEFSYDVSGRIRGVRVRDRLGGRTLQVRAHAVVNAAGAGVERVRGLDDRVREPELRPAKGIHLVVPRHRLRLRGAVTFGARDGRHLFVVPWDDVVLFGTTDSFSDEIDSPTVTIEEVHYVLEAANRAFPRAALTTNDLCSVFAAVRPLVARASEESPSSEVSRETRTYEDPSGLCSVAGGKLTTYRATAESIVSRVVSRLPRERRRAAGASRTRELPLRPDDFDRTEQVREIRRRFGLNALTAEHLVTQYGADAVQLLAESEPTLHRNVGTSRFLLAEVPWAFRTECAATLRDVLERRTRVAIFAVGQGIPQLGRIAAAAAGATGWDIEQTRAEAAAYADSVRRRYQIVAPDLAQSAA